MKKPLLVFMSSLLVGLSALGIANLHGVSAKGEIKDIEEYPFAESVSLGSSFSVPQVNIQAGEEKKPANAALILPDGTRKEDASVVLSEVGKYVLEYTAEAGGKTYTETRSFFVDYPLTQLQATSGSVQYGSHSSAPGAEGLVVDIRTGGTIQFNKVVNIASLTSRDPLFEMFVTPEKVGTADFNCFAFVMTDAYDPNNFVTVEVVNQSANANQYSYVRAGSASQTLTGVEEWNGAEKIHAGDYYGTPVRVTFQGSGAPASNKYSISFDYETRTVYCNGLKVVDLDSVAYFTELWQGFTTGEVKFSFKPSEGNDARCVISNVYGNDLSVGTVRDIQKPVIDIDYNGYEADDLPLAQAKKPYKVFGATARDSYFGACEVSCKVYQNYYSSTPTQIPVVDGAFTPSRTGKYTIEYRATDAFGNMAEILRDITARASLDAIEIDTSAIDVSALKAGIPVDLSGIAVGGGSGKVQVEYTVSHADGESAYLLTETGFKPLKAGAFKVTVNAVDYVGNTAKKELNLTVKENPNPVIEKDAALPLNFLDGFTYTLPDLEAYSYAQGHTRLTSEITVTDANGTVALKGFSYVPKVNADGDKVTLTYKVSTATGLDSRSYEIPCYQVRTTDGKGLNYLKYFRADGNVTMKAADSYSTFQTEEPVTVRFINPLLWPGFELNCRLSNASRLTLTFADSENHDDVFTFDLVSRSNKVYLDYNDTEYETNIAFGKDFTVRYDGSLNKLFLDTVGYELPGLKLFDSGKVDFSWRVSGIQSGKKATFRLIRMNQQTFNNDIDDFAPPQASLIGTSGGCYAPGTTVSTLRAVWADVLDSSSTCVMTVRDPDGNVVTSLDGVRLENVSPSETYRIRLEKYGVYMVEYTVSDSLGNSAPRSDRFRVWDSVPPTITVEGVPQTAKRNETIVLPAASVSDDSANVENYFAACFTPDGKVVYLSKADGAPAFTPTRRGEYKVVYYCFDANGNMATAEFIIKVS